MTGTQPEGDQRQSRTSQHDGQGRLAGPEDRFFEIRVTGHLNSQWSEWFENLDMKLLDNGEMILSGVIPDQAALMGILDKLNRLNLTLLSVSKVSPNQ